MLRILAIGAALALAPVHVAAQESGARAGRDQAVPPPVTAPDPAEAARCAVAYFQAQRTPGIERIIRNYAEMRSQDRGIQLINRYELVFAEVEEYARGARTTIANRSGQPVILMQEVPLGPDLESGNRERVQAAVNVLAGCDHAFNFSPAVQGPLWPRTAQTLRMTHCTEIYLATAKLFNQQNRTMAEEAMNRARFAFAWAREDNPGEAEQLLQLRLDEQSTNLARLVAGGDFPLTTLSAEADVCDGMMRDRRQRSPLPSSPAP